MLALHEGDVSRGLSLLQGAADTEAGLPFEFGPPDTVIPSHELLGTALLAHGQLEEAAQAFAIALDRTPGRRAARRGLEASTPR